MGLLSKKVSLLDIFPVPTMRNYYRLQCHLPTTLEELMG